MYIIKAFGNVLGTIRNTPMWFNFCFCLLIADDLSFLPSYICHLIFNAWKNIERKWRFRHSALVYIYVTRSQLIHEISQRLRFQFSSVDYWTQAVRAASVSRSSYVYEANRSYGYILWSYRQGWSFQCLSNSRLNALTLGSSNEIFSLVSPGVRCP